VEAPTQDELDQARTFIESVTWTTARVLSHPHAYCVRARLDDEHKAGFDWFAAMIGRYGYRGVFAPRPGDRAGKAGVYVYLDVDGWKYWLSRSAAGGVIVNRASLAPPEPVEPSATRLF
jgi:hypothetical protein